MPCHVLSIGLISVATRVLLYPERDGRCFILPVPVAYPYEFSLNCIGIRITYRVSIWINKEVVVPVFTKLYTHGSGRIAHHLSIDARLIIPRHVINRHPVEVGWRCGSNPVAWSREVLELRERRSAYRV